MVFNTDVWGPLRQRGCVKRKVQPNAHRRDQAVTRILTTDTANALANDIRRTPAPTLIGPAFRVARSLVCSPV